MAGIGAYANKRTVEGVGFGLGVQGLVLFLLDWADQPRGALLLSPMTMFARPAVTPKPRAPH